MYNPKTYAVINTHLGTIESRPRSRKRKSRMIDVDPKTIPPVRPNGTVKQA